MWFATEEVREQHKLPEQWQAYALQVIGHDGSHVEMKGGVYPENYTRGKRKGTTNYHKPVDGTECTVILSMAEYKKMIASK